MINFIGECEQILDLKEAARKVAASDVTTLITGETGVGKEVLANYIWKLSKRKNAPFVPVSCAALSSTLAEDELFGHVEGAFTGAITDTKGKIALAENGILFLDEIADLEPVAQAMLLRFLQFKEYTPLGAVSSVKANVRIIGVTNKNLLDLISLGHFRKDLYYRFNVISLTVPPLRKRNNDILLLSDYFLKRQADIQRIRKPKVSSLAAKKLLEYHWYGNVRELENTIERAFVFSDKKQIKEEDIRFESIIDSDIFLPYKEAVFAFKREYIERALDECHWNQTLTAKKLKLQRTYLARLIKELNISKI
ncbi:MAG: sigma-54-dependent Fis family transcriptional regulator [Spirochaetales bacterium]|nr:sigma-54-dependent Fis family transcriptional regulator [Spirochaetales bacterium]